VIVVVNTPFGGQIDLLPVLLWRQKSARRDAGKPIFGAARGGSGCAVGDILRDNAGDAFRWPHVDVR